MSHSSCTHQDRVNFWLLVVGSQIANLTLGPSFDHNLCCKCSNGSCKAILDIYTSRPFQQCKEHFNARCFDPCNQALNFWELRRTPSSHFQECEFHLHTCLKVGLRHKRPSSFYLGHFSLLKILDHIIKDTNIFHIKSNNSHKLSYFPQLPPFQTHFTSYRPIYLQAIDFWHVNMANLAQAVEYGHGKIFTTTLNQLDVLSLLPFPLFYCLYITLIYGMFLNKALWVFDELGRYWCDPGALPPMNTHHPGFPIFEAIQWMKFTSLLQPFHATSIHSGVFVGSLDNDFFFFFFSFFGVNFSATLWQKIRYDSYKWFLWKKSDKVTTFLGPKKEEEIAIFS